MKITKIEKGRYILHIGKAWESTAIRFEINTSYNFGLGWCVRREERELQLSVYLLGLLNVWCTFEGKRLKYEMDPISTSFTWDIKQSVIKIELLSKRGWDSSKSAILDVYWNYMDWLFGKTVYSESLPGLGIVGMGYQPSYVMIMPEGEYRVDLKFSTGYWHRPRLPFVKSIQRVEIVPQKPVPIPGKGENSWDMDEDATYSSLEAVNGRAPEQIVADFKIGILARRSKYGGRDWLPRAARNER